MSDSTGLGNVADECAAGSAELVVEADAGGEGEEALEDAFFDAVENPTVPLRALKTENREHPAWARWTAGDAHFGSGRRACGGANRRPLTHLNSPQRDSHNL